MSDTHSHSITPLCYEDAMTITTQGKNSPGYNRYCVGKGYCEAVKYIFTNPHLKSEAQFHLLFLPMCNLAGLALELLLKAWLLHAGKDAQEVRRFNHDVVKLYKAAAATGLPTTPALDELVTVVGPDHKALTHRYLEDGLTYTMVKWRAACDALDHLETVVDEAIGASASKGLAPGH